MGLLFVSGKPGCPLLVWNSSESAPLGLYRAVSSAGLQKGSWVLVAPPEDVKAFAAKRGYLPAAIPMVKQVAALHGDTVCRFGPTIVVNGARAATALAKDHAGRDLPRWSGCVRIGAADYFLLMTAAPRSFDSRYFGTVSAANIIETLEPVWIR
jgi:conjugative transfer signal peptidase TraF